MLRGAHAVSLDAKGRLAIPTRLRSSLLGGCDGRLVCTLSVTDPCLLLFPLPAWERLEQRISAMPGTNALARSMQRILLGHASDLEMDSAGRILLPSFLRESAGWTAESRELVLSGQLNRFEIWSRDGWQRRIADDLQAVRGADLSAVDELKDFSLNDLG